MGLCWVGWCFFKVYVYLEFEYEISFGNRVGVDVSSLDEVILE